ncbi:hypothetical protein BH10ACT7_BH10ACT7_32380 [soil metagenome]
MPRTGALALVPVTLLIALLAACAPPTTELPAGVTVSVFQNRFDYGVRQLELKVSNDTEAPVTVTRASLESSRFATPAVWDRPQVVPAGAARDLRVQLTEPVCGEPVRDRVVLEFTLADGRSGTASVEPTDETGRLDAVNAEDCLGLAVAAIATIEAGDTVQWTAGARSPAVLDILVTPTGAAGEVTVHFAKGTVLLSLVDGTGAEGYDLPVEASFDATTPAGIIQLHLVPARCDPHAVAEDKRGTFFPLEVETSDGAVGRIYVPVSNEVRSTLYTFFGDYCGLP